MKMAYARGDVTSKAAGIIGLNKWIEFKIVLHNSGASYYVNNLNGAAGSWTLVYIPLIRMQLH